MKRTVIIGASTNPSRYAYKAANSLVRHGHEIIPLGIKAGEVAGKEIILTKPYLVDVDTVTLYVGPQNQEEWIDYIINLNPKRIIFNPGTENITLMEKAKEVNIEVIEGCTLVMLSIGNF